jgi:serine protease Do
MRGEVIGINSQIYSRSGGFMGISFAIPIDEASRVAEQLRCERPRAAGRIGVQIDQVTRDVAESIGLAARRAPWCAGRGRLAADKAGIEAGDIITKFNGQAIRTRVRPASPGGQYEARQPREPDGVPPRRFA